MDVNIFCESLNISATTERCKKRFSAFLCSVVLLTNLIVVDVEFKRVAHRVLDTDGNGCAVEAVCLDLCNAACKLVD